MPPTATHWITRRISCVASQHGFSLLLQSIPSPLIPLPLGTGRFCTASKVRSVQSTYPATHRFRYSASEDRRKTWTVTLGYVMIESDIGQADAIVARDGAAIRRLTLRQSLANGVPVLVDTAGIVVDPWTVELLRWPPAVEAELRRSGYLIDRHGETEPWCNCAD